MRNLIPQSTPISQNGIKVEKTGKLPGGWSVSYANQGASGAPGNSAFCLSADEELTFSKLALTEEFRWFRIECKIPKEAIRKGKFLFRASYKKLAQAPNTTTSIKVVEYLNGKGETHTHITRNLSRSGSIRKINHQIEFFGPALDDADYTLCFEFKEPLEFYFGDIELIQLSNTDCNEQEDIANNSYYPPYRVFSYQVSERLAHLNDQMDSMLRDNPAKWVEEMLKVSLSLEDYDTATGLVDYLLQLGQEDEKLPNSSIPHILSTLIATGRTNEALNLISCFYSSRNDDSAILLTRRLGSNPKPLYDYRLPSGKDDIFNLSRDLNNTNSVSFETLVMHAPKTKERNLLWANYFLNKSDGEYISRVNKYLEQIESPFKVKLGDFKENILARMKFEPRANIVIPSDGPLVSVIIAAYNASETIDYALKSILNQTYQNIEVLICDDCSTDNTVELLRPYLQDSRVRLFKSQSNQGPYNIRNDMLKKARGELITFHDADDLAFPHRISTQLQLMMDNNSKVALGLWLRIRTNGHVVAFKDGTYLRQCLNSIMFVRSVFDDYGPYRSTLTAADSEFYEKIRGQLEPRHIAFASEPLVLGLWGPNSLTQSAGIEADELGFRSAARRGYSSLSSRQRILGKALVTDSQIQKSLRDGGIWRAPQSTTELIDAEQTE